MNKVNVIKAALMTPGLNNRWGLPILFEGSPGVGKSSIIEAVAESLGLKCITIISSIREPSDFSGLPIPTKINGETVIMYAAASWATELKDTEGAVIFTDELTTCPPSTQAAVLRMVLNGKVGDYTLPETVRFIAACNSAEEAAGGWDLTPPLANRFGHINWYSPTPKEWIDYMLHGVTEDDTKPTAVTKQQKEVMLKWDKAFMKAKTTVAAFIQAKPGMLFDMPKLADQNVSKAWPSPRSWEMATRAIAGADVHGLDESDKAAFISSFIGSGPFLELVSFTKNLDLPNPMDILEGKITYEADPLRVDRNYAVLLSTSTILLDIDLPKYGKLLENYYTMVEGLLEHSVGSALSCSNPVLSATRNSKHKISKTESRVVNRILELHRVSKSSM